MTRGEPQAEGSPLRRLGLEKLSVLMRSSLNRQRVGSEWEVLLAQRSARFSAFIGWCQRAQVQPPVCRRLAGACVSRSTGRFYAASASLGTASACFASSSIRRHLSRLSAWVIVTTVATSRLTWVWR